MPESPTLFVQLAPETARHFATGDVAFEGTRHEVHLLAACRRADRGQRAKIDAPLWDVPLTRRTVEALIDNPTQDRSSVFHHQLVKACRKLADAADGINNNPPCQLCGGNYAHQFFMDGFWAHDLCIDERWENAA